MYSCRSTSSKVSPAALSKDNDLKENRLLFKLNLFLLSYPHILSLPPKGAGSPAKKPVSPGFFAWVLRGDGHFVSVPIVPVQDKGTERQGPSPYIKTPRWPKTVQGGAAFRGTVLLFPSPLFLFRTRGQKRKDRPLKSHQEKMGLIASERLSFSACAAARSLPRVV